jgi:hypothetical protein
MRAGAASGESFGAGRETPPSRIPVHLALAQSGMASEPLFPQMERRRVLFESSVCEYRASLEKAPRESNERADAASKRVPLVGYS